MKRKCVFLFIVFLSAVFIMPGIASKNEVDTEEAIKKDEKVIVIKHKDNMNLSIW